MSILFFSTLVASAGGFIVLTYQSFAQTQGWPVGVLFKNVAFQMIFGALAIVGSAWTAFSDISILGGFGVLVGGFVLAFLISYIFKSWVQWFALMPIIGSYILQYFM